MARKAITRDDYCDDSSDFLAIDASFTADDSDEPTQTQHWWPQRKANRERRSQVRHGAAAQSPGHEQPERRRRGPSRAARNGTEEFRCRHCRAFVGRTIGGGRHRNHCPFCLHSRHVDDRRPGDRGSDCGATMAPIARFDRPGGEPVIIHRCYGCGLERHNRLAADDSIALLTRLPLVAPRLGQRDSGAHSDDWHDLDRDEDVRRQIS